MQPPIARTAMSLVAPLSEEFLTHREVKTLAGVAAIDKQETVLKADGIPFRRRKNRLLVSRFHVREWLLGRVVTPSRGIRWDLVK